MSDEATHEIVHEWIYKEMPCHVKRVRLLRKGTVDKMERDG